MTKIIPPILLMLLITGTSSIPMDGSVTHFGFLTSMKPGIQNLLHIPVFGLLCYLWLRVFFSLSRSYLLCCIFAVLVTVVFGILDEFHQLYVPGRFASLLDVILNIIGAGLGITAFAFNRRVHKTN